jgi:alkylation response protein AidB-like acyl-CoA dehydrogenase
MDLGLSDDQKLLKETVERLMQDNYDIDKRRAYIAENKGYSSDNWQQMAELGLLGLPFDEEFGGFGGSAVDVMVVMEALGNGLAVEPFLSTVVLCGGLIHDAGSAAQKSAHLVEIAAGKRTFALAHSEPQARYNLANVISQAGAQGDGFQLSGTKCVALNGDSADWFIISARSSGSARDQKGISLFLIPAATPGLEVTGYQTVDGLRAADIQFDNITVASDALIGNLGDGYAILERAIDKTIGALAAESVGIMDTINALTLEYSKNRNQFGKAIGTFQVVQHRLTDMLMETEQARSMAQIAAMALDVNDEAARARELAGVKARLGKAGRFVGQESIQLHAGMGMTDEMTIGHYFKRLTMIDRSYGDADYSMRRYTDGLTK